ncbi:ankyrin repeat domain-containing protein [Roseateles sp. YR242]|uniref:ankyrin repeat domain-containing protein n=1 Tax=Roseateles sp. YR242 TaxID=1855305 RepID=UPI000B86D9FB|nr:ankyrin repeat domain-containing protein [Roseateles sp. YR242]
MTTAPSAIDVALLLNRYARHAEFLGEPLDDMNQVGGFGSQIIHLASFAGRLDDVVLLLNAGLDKDAIGDLGLSALHFAVLGGAVDVVRLLVDYGANLAIENEYGETARQMADLIGERSISKLLAEVDDSSTHIADDPKIARQRWADFKAIQQGNFWPE